jgi:hypothetical protein
VGQALAADNDRRCAGMQLPSDGRTEIVIDGSPVQRMGKAQLGKHKVLAQQAGANSGVHIAACVG